MGWLFRHCTRKDLIAERSKDWERETPEGVTVKTTCLAHCYRGGAFAGVLWAVLERTFSRNGEQTQPSERWITCDLLRYQRDSGWGYKDMCESEHPYYYSCPKKYINLVPIDKYGGNEEWREQVQSHHARRKAKQRTPTIGM